RGAAIWQEGNRKYRLTRAEQMAPLTACNLPDPYRSFEVAAQDCAAVRREGDRFDPVRGKIAYHFPGGDVPQPERDIAVLERSVAAPQHRATVGRERDRGDRVCMTSERADLSAGRNVPKLQGPVVAS